MSLHGNRFASAAEQLIHGLNTEGFYRPDMHLRMGMATVALALLAIAKEIRTYQKPTPNNQKSSARKNSNHARGRGAAVARASAFLAPWVAASGVL